MIEFTVHYKYTKDWIPPRCRKPRPGLFEDSVTVAIRTATNDDVPVAAIVWDFGRNPETGNYETFPIEVRWFDNRFWVEATPMNGSLAYMPDCFTVEDVVSRASHEGYTYRDTHPQDDVVAEIRDFCNEWLVIDGKPWHYVDEPRYVVQTFGLGHNHGGTSWFVDTMYNSNISWRAYYNANDFEGMVEHYFDVALGRGDTRDAHRHAMYLADGKGYEYIDVRMPDAFKCDPVSEHGDGDPFLNRLYGLTQSADSAAEAGIFALAALASEIGE